MSKEYRTQILAICDTLKKIASTYTSIAEDAVDLADKYRQMAESDDADEQVQLAKEVLTMSAALDIKFAEFESDKRFS